MAYLVIAIGGLMALAGGYLVNYGYAIVQVERGWSSVIAGAVFLTGGLLAIGLGLLLRAILDVRRSLLASLVPAGITPAGLVAADAFGSGMPTMPSFGEPVARSPLETSPSFAPLSVEARATGLAAPPESDMGNAPLFGPAHVGLAGDAALAATASDAPPHVEAADGTVHDTGHDTTPETVHDSAPPDVSHPDTLADGRAPEPAVTGGPAMDTAVMDDWLDQAFSDLDREPAFVDAPRPGTGAPELERVAMPAATPLAVEQVPLPPDPPSFPQGVDPAPVPNALAKTPEPYNSPVIGRYESDETSYVMYADGSIEAQSSAGIYRFASMAELKAFIEG